MDNNLREDFNQIGKRVPKQDAWDKVMGKTKYIHDINLSGMLYGKILYSKYAHARIKAIDTSKAEKLPGVKAVLTGYNTPEIKIGFLKDNPVLKKDKVCQFRDEVAAVAATNPEIAAKALELIEVEYEELPAVFDPVQALAGDAPLIHEENGSNMLKLPWKLEVGEVAGAREAAAFVAEDTYQVSWVNHGCLGTAGCIAEFNSQGELTVHSPTQIRYLARRDFMEAMTALGLEGKRVRVIGVTAGGSFGGKLDTNPYEYITILLAYYTGKPVKIIFNRAEEFYATTPRQPATIKIAQGCDREGKLLFRDIDMILDNGAYASWGATTPSVMMMPASSLYKVPNIKYRATCVYTNNIYAGAMRGYGNPQVTFAIESQLDVLAEKAGIDPADFRLLNANTPGEKTPQGFQVTTCGLKECIEAVRQELDWDNKRGRGNGRGVGMASLVHNGGGARIYRSDGCGVILTIDDFAKVTVMTGATDMGQGSDTVMAQIVAEELGLEVEDILIINNNMDLETWDVGAHASRTTFVAGNAALFAAKKAKEQIFEIACRELGGEKEEFYLDRRQVFSKKDPKVKMDLNKLLRKAHFTAGGQMVVADYFYDPPTEMPNKEMLGNVSATYTYGTHGVEVEVDRDTGEVKILKYLNAIDAGRAINPMLLEGQMEGGIAMGIGYALLEEMKLSQGKVQNANLLDYRLPTSCDVPKLKTFIVETEDQAGPFGAKGIGEPPIVAVAPAIANAIYDAIGVRVKELPLSREKIIAALSDRSRN